MVARWDGQGLHEVVRSAADRLGREKSQVDALNVYPLPDGDTGRNMHQTITAGVAKAQGTGPAVSDVSAAIAKGALMGARGNSGVILSQILRGFAEAFAGSETAGPDELRRAFALARQYAYSSVDRPAPGTILSLCAAVADNVGTEAEIVDVLRSAIGIGAEALEHTMEDNPLNKAAGVIDAGAYGMWLLLVGALESLDPAAQIPRPRLRREGAAILPLAEATVASWTGGHCVQYLVISPRRAAADMRREMVEAGADSVLVVGDDSMLKVHAHAAKPETVVAVGESAGRLEDLVIEDFDEMVEQHERATGIVLQSPRRPVAAVAVLPGDGFAQIARSFYVTPIEGGATMNPSVGQIAEAIGKANASTVIVLPNDKNVILAAREAAKLGQGVDVQVVETTSVAHGMAAVAAFDPMRPADEILERMREAAGAAKAIEVTRATRDATIDGVRVREGDAIALVDGRLAASGSEPSGVLAEAAASLEEIGIVTVYTGEGVSDDEAEAAAERVREALPGAEVEVRRGGQPHYPFIAQVE